MRPARRRSRPFALAWVAAAVGLAGAASADVKGSVALGVEGARLSDVGPVVVYLEPLTADGVPRPLGRRQIRQRNARFTPGFMVVARGQRIDMPNDDAIYHNVFSYSKGNEFDLGLYPTGESRSVTFDEPGVVKIYCSIHESMNATVFVSPSPWFAVADADGAFSIADVPAGRYRLRTWGERLPESARQISVEPGGSTRVAIVLAGPATHPAAPAP